MSSPFISINSWNQPGAILQAADAEEMIEGGPEDWGKLREVLARRRKTGRDSIHPQSAAIGYITYEGAFRFAWFPKISVLTENGFSKLWNTRRAQAESAIHSVVARTEGRVPRARDESWVARTTCCPGGQRPQ